MPYPEDGCRSQKLLSPQCLSSLACRAASAAVVNCVYNSANDPGESGRHSERLRSFYGCHPCMHTTAKCRRPAALPRAGLSDKTPTVGKPSSCDDAMPPHRFIVGIADGRMALAAFETATLEGERLHQNAPRRHRRVRTDRTVLKALRCRRDVGSGRKRKRRPCGRRPHLQR